MEQEDMGKSKFNLKKITRNNNNNLEVNSYKNYEITLKANGLISELPDAQKVFGAICNIILNIQGKEQLNEYLSSFDQTPFLLHSSVFPKGLLPYVQKTIYNRNQVNKKLREIYFSENRENIFREANEIKKISNIKYITNEVYEKIIKEPKKSLNYLKEHQKITIANGIIFLNGTNTNIQFVNKVNTRIQKDKINPSNNENGDLFYDHVLETTEEQEYVLYCKTTKDKKYLENLFSYLDFFSIGNRGSVGKNSFKLVSIKENKLKSPKNYKLLLSKMLYKEGEIKLARSYYDLDSSIYIGSYAYHREKVVIGKITKFKEGSVIIPDNGAKEYYGKVEKINYNGKDVYHYGIGFVL